MLLTNTKPSTSDPINNTQIPSDLRLVNGKMRTARTLSPLLVEQIQILLLSKLGRRSSAASGLSSCVSCESESRYSEVGGNDG